MIAAHLLFAHFLADYPLQTNWLIVRKGQSWDGLALHGLMVLFMAILVLPQYFPFVLIPLLALSGVHTIQDWGKIYTGPRIKIHPIIPYLLDQVLHYIIIGIVQVAVGSLLVPAPGPWEVMLMATGAVVVAVTRAYDVTWWANWLDMIPYMNRWTWWGYAERLAMVALSTFGLFYLAPLCAAPRLLYAWSHGTPIWKQRRGLLEMGIGIVFSIALGLVLHRLLPG